MTIWKCLVLHLKATFSEEHPVTADSIAAFKNTYMKLNEIAWISSLSMISYRLYLKLVAKYSKSCSLIN